MLIFQKIPDFSYKSKQKHLAELSFKYKMSDNSGNQTGVKEEQGVVVVVEGVPMAMVTCGELAQQSLLRIVTKTMSLKTLLMTRIR